MFSLISCQDGAYLGSCEAIVGLDSPTVGFWGGDGARYLRIDFVRCEWTVEFSAKIEKWSGKSAIRDLAIEIRIVSDAGMTIGSYRFVPNVLISNTEPARCTSFAGFLGARPRRTELQKWQRLKDEPAPAKHYWLACPVEEKRAWLNVVRMYFFSQARSESAIADGATYDLDGRIIQDVPSFYLALGEAIRGGYGYFGSDLGSLADCISGVSVANGAFSLRWLHSEVSRKFLDEYASLVESADLIASSVSFLDYGEPLDQVIENPAHFLRPGESYFQQICSVFGTALILA